MIYITNCLHQLYQGKKFTDAMNNFRTGLFLLVRGLLQGDMVGKIRRNLASKDFLTENATVTQLPK